MLNKDEITCLFCFAIIATIIIVGLAINNIEQAIECLKMAGVCLGGVLLFFVYALVAGFVSARKYNTLQILSQEYPVRCQITKVKADLNLVTVLDDLPGESKNNLTISISCTMTMASHGLCITHSKMSKEQAITADPNIPFDLFQRDWSNPLIIHASYKLFCIIHKHEKDAAQELVLADLATYTDDLSKIPSEDQLEIVVLFRDYLQKSDLQKQEHLDQPLQLKFIVLNNDGRYDAIATYELCKKLYERLHPEPSDEDDSWAYRSRPIYW